MRVATWNVNSLKARLERVEEWMAEVSPDIVCLQETKLADRAFPALTFQSLGYEGVHFGQGRWNGVAILSRVGLTEVQIGFSDGDAEDAEARLLWATCGGLRVATVYIPNGRAIGHEMFDYKLAFIARLRRLLDAQADPSAPLVVAGDFNIAPDDRDVWDPAAFIGSTHVSPAERAALADLEGWGLQDLFRLLYDGAGLYSWWDYRAGNFHKGKGMRIDLMLGTKSVADGLRAMLIDRNARKGKLPSDHAPLVADLDLVAQSP